MLGDVTASALKRVAEKLAKRYCDQRILGLPLDVTQEESTKRFAEDAANAVSGRERIDVLVNNAAIYGDALAPASTSSTRWNGTA